MTENNSWKSVLKTWPFWTLCGILLLWGATFFIYKLGLDKTEQGQFGDMFGAVNALFSGFAFWGLIITVRQQKEELELQRKELKETKEEFRIQNETLQRQRFENTFFQLISLHNEIVDKMVITYNPSVDDDIPKDNETEMLPEKSLFKRDVFTSLKRELQIQLREQFYYWEHHDDGFSRELKPISDKKWAYSEIKDGYIAFFKRPIIEAVLSHYFRNIYHIFKYIHQTNLIEPEDKQFYATIVRAQLSPDELFLLYYNVMIPGLGNPNFLYLQYKYDIFQNFNEESIEEFPLNIDVLYELTNQIKDTDPFKEKEPKFARL